MKKTISFFKQIGCLEQESIQSKMPHHSALPTDFPAIRTEKAETGRSMLEILAVLAIMGVLAVVGVAVYKYAMDKHRANTILQDAHLGFASIRGTRADQFDWTPVNFEPKSGKPVDVLRDSDRDDYVRVQEIELSVCKQILLMAVPGKLMFYDEQGEDMLTCPDELNTIIFAFEGTRAPGVNCETGTDCEGEGAYCNMDKGVCRTCPVEEGFVVSPNGEACWPVCDEDTETTCMTDTERWCCDNETELCGDEAGVCELSSGVCEYRLKSQTSEKEADCSYRYENQTSKKYSECECKFTNQTSEKYADCSYESSGTAENFKLNLIKGCPSGQYCYLAYSDDSCENSLGSAGASIMHGTCTAWAMTNPSCRIRSLGDVLSSCTTCPNGQYCYLAYKDDQCEQTLGSEGAATMYGTCTAWAMTNPTCRIKELSGVVTPIQTCPNGQYCYLAYQDEGCESSLGSTGAEIMYGACTAWAMTNPTCPIKWLDTDILTPVEKCPSSKYCYLKYASPGCVDPVGSTGSDPIYGVCIPGNSNNANCPSESSE